MQSIWAKAAYFGEWWVSELADLIPEWLLKLGRGRERRLVCTLLDGKFELIFEYSGTEGKRVAQYETSDSGLIQLATHLKKYLRRTPKLHVGVRLNTTDCLIRRMEYPVAVRPRIREILGLDLKQKTPFETDEIYTDFVCETLPDQPTLVAVTQLIVKRNILDEIIEKLSSVDIKVNFADVCSEISSQPYAINFLKNLDTARRSSLRNKIHRALFLFIGFLACLIVLLTFHQQEQALQSLNFKTTKIRKKATAVRKAALHISEQFKMVHRQLRAKLGRYTVIEVWEEITKRLPDSVWVSELQVRGDTVHISGFAGSAASLVEILDKSPIFQKSKLTAQVRLDPKTKKERFSVETNIIIKSREAQEARPQGGS